MTISEYDYSDLRAKATATGATQSDIDNLGAWFERYGSTYWNGEHYDADGIEVHPKHKQITDDEFEITGYEIR